VEVPIDGFAAITRRALDDPLAGVRAAVLARNVAARQLRDYAEQARGAGRTWDEVAEALGIAADEDETPRDERAYLLLIEGRTGLGDRASAGFHRSSARWTYASCGERITDWARSDRTRTTWSRATIRAASGTMQPLRLRHGALVNNVVKLGQDVGRGSLSST
jgi:hypothetical protein